jgi:hypothetical protein
MMAYFPAIKFDLFKSNFKMLVGPKGLIIYFSLSHIAHKIWGMERMKFPLSPYSQQTMCTHILVH